jgi:hypothetical protein
MKKLLNVTLLLILMLSLATPAFAQDGHRQPGQVIFGNDRTLEAGDIIEPGCHRRRHPIGVNRSG